MVQVLYLARAILGFAGESTPFGTVESLQRLFPNQFLLMAGARRTSISLLNWCNCLFPGGATSPEIALLFGKQQSVLLIQQERKKQ